MNTFFECLLSIYKARTLPPPWKCSRPGWMGLWATWSSGRCPCLWYGGWN